MFTGKLLSVIVLAGCGIALMVKGVYVNRKIKLAAKLGYVPEDHANYLDGKIQPFVGTVILILTILLACFG